MAPEVITSGQRGYGPAVSQPKFHLKVSRKVLSSLLLRVLYPGPFPLSLPLLYINITSSLLL